MPVMIKQNGFSYVRFPDDPHIIFAAPFREAPLSREAPWSSG